MYLLFQDYHLHRTYSTPQITLPPATGDHRFFGMDTPRDAPRDAPRGAPSQPRTVPTPDRAEAGPRAAGQSEDVGKGR